MLHECKYCHKRGETLKMCAACSIVWYCNSQCQRNDWPVHLVYCNPGRPITTADRLVAAVHVEIPPEDDMTLHDYGFTQFRTTVESETRLQVYRLLIVELQVKAKTIHRWMEEGILGTMMRDTFDARLSPDKRQQKAYLWFRNNQSTFGRNPVSLMDSERAKVMQDGKLAAWMFMGGSPSDSDETIRAAMQELSEDHRACFLFIALLAIHVRPCTGISMGSTHAWVDFGFCGCTNPREEGDLGAKYGRLIGRVDYNTFYQAYISSSLPKLFAENGLAIDNPFVLDVLGSRKYKSVWYLKDFVCTDDETARNTLAVPVIGGDYGFNNCQSISEVVALRNAYKQVFMRTDANPLALHEACIRGKLYEYVGQVARLKPARLFERLMKNPYPPGKNH